MPAVPPPRTRQQKDLSTWPHLMAFGARDIRSIVLRSRLRDLTSRMRTNPALQRMGKWLETLQADLPGAATERLHEAGTLASRVARQLLGPAQSGPRAIVNATGILTLAAPNCPWPTRLDEMALVARDYRTFDHSAFRPARMDCRAGADGRPIGHAAAALPCTRSKRSSRS